MKLEQKEFAGYPSGWVRAGKLTQITADHPQCVALLKLYLALVCWPGPLESAEERAGYHPGVFLTSSPTYTNLQKISGLDRSEILPSILALQDLGLITAVRAKGGSNCYSVLDFGKGWAKVPLSLVQENKLRDLSLKSTNIPLHKRKQALLDCFKLYMLFLALRDNHSNRAKVSYNRMEELTGTRRRHIRRALSVLSAMSLVHIEPTYLSTAEGYKPGSNLYFIIGLADFRPQKSLLIDPGRLDPFQGQQAS